MARRDRPVSQDVHTAVGIDPAQHARWVTLYAIRAVKVEPADIDPRARAVFFKPTVVCCVAFTSLIHARCSDTVSVDSPSGLTLRSANPPASCAVRPISVVQTGVKSPGWLKKNTHLLPIQS